ncbi:unnamed protein product, partial [Oncorhynchus mykiss]
MCAFQPPPAKYGGRHTVTLIPGDGIGPELLNHVKELFRFSCVPVDFEVVNVSSATEDDINNAITAIRRNGVALKGNIETLHTLPASHKSRNNLLRLHCLPHLSVLSAYTVSSISLSSPVSLHCLLHLSVQPCQLTLSPPSLCQLTLSPPSLCPALSFYFVFSISLSSPVSLHCLPIS